MLTPALSALTGLALLATVPAHPADAPPRPNIVLIYVDDLGYGDLGCYGAPRNPTPNLDRLAAGGMRFTDFYVAQAVCSASRAALLSGCYPNRLGIQGALGPNARIGIHPDERLLPELLQDLGYATAIYGKWHLGDADEFLPARNGFDDYFGLPYSNDMWPRHPGVSRFPALKLIEGQAVIARDPDQRRLTRWYRDHAVRFIEQHADAPFFLYLAHSMPHVPLYVSPPYQDATGRGLYADVIREIDDSVGAILETLARRDLERSTLVIFASDNGPWLSYGDHAGSAGSLREGKGTTFEGGVRVPFLARWPGQISAGSTCAEPAMTIDVLPTIAAALGAQPPSARPIDGLDIGPLLRGEAGARSPHEALWFYWNGELQAIRSGPWKLHLPHEYQSLDTPGSGGMPGRYARRSIGLSLFDLAADPTETSDVAASHPEVVARLAALAETARAELGDSLTGRTGSGVREPGRVAP